MTSRPQASLIEVEHSSVLKASVRRVWDHATDFAGINTEMHPLLRMTAPRGATRLTPELIRPGEKLFRSWLLLFGVLPIDYDDLTIVELEPERRFLERSRMLSASMWEHERLLEPAGDDGCRVTDRVRFAPRSAVHSLVLRLVVPRVFAHRHRRLRQLFGAPLDGS